MSEIRFASNKILKYVIIRYIELITCQFPKQNVTDEVYQNSISMQDVFDIDHTAKYCVVFAQYIGVSRVVKTRESS